MRVSLHDDVVLTSEVGGFPAGAAGAVIAVHEDGVEVEVVDRTTGETLGFAEPAFDAVALAHAPAR